ncbi:MAG: hypothetical protein EXR66_03470 [Dehalococcoidia bacterium]|nr:hypothetical protein [Dehalococcoidia bacterium]
MPDPADARTVDFERARAITIAKLAACYHVACGGLDIASTLEAMRARIDSALAAGDMTLAEALKAGIEAAGAARPA